LALIVSGGVAVQNQKLLVQFTDGLHGLLEPMIVFEGTPHFGHLRGPQTDLPRLSAGIANIQNPQGMSFSAGTFRAATGVAEGTLEKRAAKDLVDVRDGGSELVSFAGGIFTCHQY
jgi:hypothetical protein